MDKKKISIALLLISVFSSLFLFGCKIEKIQFNRESQAQVLMNRINDNHNQTRIQKSSGMLILKDEPKNDFNIKFGSFGPNFDIPTKF